MSSEAFKEFMAKVQNDEGLKQELRAVGEQASKPLDAIIAFADSKGYKITAEDIAGELAERELEAVAGGSGVAYKQTTLTTPPPQDLNTAGQLLNSSWWQIFLPSDRRLKTNIKRLGTHPLGIGIYEYDMFGRREQGVMADEVERIKPEAVSIGAFGVKMVDYAAL